MNRSVVLIAAAAGGVALLLGSASALFAIDNTISQAGRSAPPPPSRFAAVGPDCEIAQPNPEHLFVAVAVDHGDTLTNIQLDDPKIATTMVRVVVDVGARPITVLLQSDDPVIWDFEGAVDRVVRAIVVPGYRNRVAIRGLSAERVDFLKLARCPAQSVPFKNDTKDQRDEILRGLFGRLPDRVKFASEPNSIGLPDLQPGTPSKSAPPRAGQTEAEKNLTIYYPGGFRIVEPNSLQSPAQVFTPETFPNQAGLIQLERAGAIRPALREEVDRFIEGYSNQFRSKLDPEYRLRVGFTYVILRDLMFPVGGLGGAHSKSFLVLPGVPAPRGDVGHGCLAFMDGFRANDSCLGDDREAIQLLKKLPEDDAAKPCRLFEPPDDASVEVLSIYKPRVRSPVDVRVNKRGAVILVLNTYEPAVWRISASESTRIAGIILTGYYTSKVEGIQPDTPVINLDYKGSKNRPPVVPACAPLHDYLGSHFRGGPGAMVLDRQISALTGKSIDKFRGAHELDSIEIP